MFAPKVRLLAGDGCRGGAPCNIDQHVDRTEATLNCADVFVNDGKIGEIPHQAKTFPTVGLDLVNGASHRCCVDVSHTYLYPLDCQSFCDGAAQTSATTQDQRGAPT